MIINQNKKIIIVIATIIIIIVLFLTLAIIPLTRAIITNSKALATERQKMENLLKETDEIKDSELFYQLQLENIKKINEMFINAGAPIEFMSSLEESASSSRLTVEITPSSSSQIKATKASLVESLDFQLTVEGSASDCFEFINRLENNPYLTNIRSVNIVREDQLNSNDKNLSETVVPSISAVKATIIISVFIKQ